MTRVFLVGLTDDTVSCQSMILFHVIFLPWLCNDGRSKRANSCWSFLFFHVIFYLAVDGVFLLSDVFFSISRSASYLLLLSLLLSTDCRLTDRIGNWCPGSFWKRWRCSTSRNWNRPSTCWWPISNRCRSAKVRPTRVTVCNASNATTSAGKIREPILAAARQEWLGQTLDYDMTWLSFSALDPRPKMIYVGSMIYFSTQYFLLYRLSAAVAVAWLPFQETEELVAQASPSSQMIYPPSSTTTLYTPHARINTPRFSFCNIKSAERYQKKNEKWLLFDVRLYIHSWVWFSWAMIGSPSTLSLFLSTNLGVIHSVHMDVTKK